MIKFELICEEGDKCQLRNLKIKTEIRIVIVKVVATKLFRNIEQTGNILGRKYNIFGIDQV